MKRRKFSAHHSAPQREEKPDPHAIIEALEVMERKIENLSDKVQHLLELVGTLT